MSKSEPRPEYDFRGGLRGRHAPRVGPADRLRELDADLALLYPDSASVNAALRRLRRSQPRKQRPAVK